MNEDWVRWTDENEEELGVVGLLMLALVVLVVAWISLCTIEAYLN